MSLLIHELHRKFLLQYQKDMKPPSLLWKILRIYKKISLLELLNALSAPEQKRLMREEKKIEGALAAKHEDDCEVSRPRVTNGKFGNQKKFYPPCQHCGKKGHPPFRCWRRPEAKCSKCNQLGHEAIICKEIEQQ